jgi:hypothetical protein
MTNSEQGAGCETELAYGGDGYYQWCKVHRRPHDQCKISVLQAKVADLVKERLEFRKSERELSDAYLRIRQMVNAWDTQPGGADRFEVTEGKIKEMLARVQALEAVVRVVITDCEEGPWKAEDMSHMTETRIYRLAKEALRPSQGEPKHGPCRLCDGVGPALDGCECTRCQGARAHPKGQSAQGKP